jgi:hypothetical protein
MRNIYKSLILVFILILTPNVQAIQVGGIISQDTTWSITSEPYIITTPIQVAWGRTLTINPGVTVKNGEIKVFGNLQARGTSINKIVFNNVKINPYRDGDFANEKKHFIALSHCLIEGGSIYAPAPTYVEGTLLLEDSVIDGIENQIYLNFPTSDVSIQRNIFKNVNINNGSSGCIEAFLSDGPTNTQKNIMLRLYDNYFNDSVSTCLVAYTKDDASILVLGNTFPRVQRPLLKLRSDSNGNVYAYENYWGTSLEREISSMIYDGNDDLMIPFKIKYDNFLSEPSPFAPDPPAIKSHPSSLTVNSGQSATFSVTASGRNATYQWMNNGVPILGAMSPVYTINSAQPNNGGQISVLVSNWDGTATSTAATLTVNSLPPPPPVVTAPSIISQPTSVSVTAGASASFSVSAAGTSPSYQWYKDGNAISGATGASHSISNAQASDAGSYSVLVSNSAGSVTSNAATLTVAPPPVSITSDLSTVSVPIKKLIPRFMVTTNFGAKTFAAKGLPKGLKLNTKTGVISGKPTKAGTYTVTLTARKMKGKKVEQQATATKVVIVF